MHLGLQDAHNLTWKMSDVLRGIASNPEKLLDSYNEEREPIAKANIEGTGASTKIGETGNFVVASVRDLMASVAFKIPRVKEMVFKKTMQRYSLRELLIDNQEFTVIFIASCLASTKLNVDLIEKFWKDTRSKPVRRLVIQSAHHSKTSGKIPDYIIEEEAPAAEDAFYSEENSNLPNSVSNRVGLYQSLTSYFAGQQTASVVLFVRSDLYISHAKLVSNESDLGSALGLLSSMYK